MQPLNRERLVTFIEAELRGFYAKRLENLSQLKLESVLKRKNPYLFKAKGIHTALELVRAILDAYLSSSEEENFGQVLEHIAIFVAEQVHGGRKSALAGIDLEFDKEAVRYLVQIKSGTNWANSSQRKRLRQDFREATAYHQEHSPQMEIMCVEGSCYGRRNTKTETHTIFWEFLSGDPNLYLDLIVPMGSAARTFSTAFEQARVDLERSFAATFAERFCHPDGTLDWQTVLAFISAAP